MINLSFLSLSLFLNIIGVIALYSADNQDKNLLMKQISFLPIGYVISMLIACVNTNFLKYYSSFVYYISLLFLIITFFAGKISMGAQRWVNVGFFHLQPSEFIKIGIILIMAQFFDNLNMKEIYSYKKLVKPIALTLVAFMMVLIQPDLATSIIITALSVAILFAVGIKMRNFIISGIIIIICMPILWGKMHDYQKNRVLIFLNPEKDQLSSGYNINQAKITIGNGGVIGRGILKGDQTRYKFVPENRTDFIFTVIAEEFGFIGAFALIMIYFAFIYYIFQISIMCNDFFLKITTYGSGMLFLLHFLINISMNLGLIPVAGVPLPLISYGRSASMTAFMLIGLVLNASVNKEK